MDQSNRSSNNFSKKKRPTHLEITADKPLSNKLKAEIRNRDIIFSFLREARPAITGFLKKDEYSTRFIIIEIKDEAIKLYHIYQSRKYVELMDASMVFLVSTVDIPEEIKKLSHIVFTLLSLPSYKKVILCHFDNDSKQTANWYEKNPFEDDYFWK
jgi:hypothetical protein